VRGKKGSREAHSTFGGVGSGNPLVGRVFAEAAGYPAHARALQGHRPGVADVIKEGQITMNSPHAGGVPRSRQAT